MDAIEAWLYIERSRGKGENRQYFIEHYKLPDLIVQFVRDRMGGEAGKKQLVNKSSQFIFHRCITNCYQKFEEVLNGQEEMH